MPSGVPHTPARFKGTVPCLHPLQTGPAEVICQGRAGTPKFLNLKVQQARARLELRARATLREDGFLYNDAYAEILGDKHLALEHRTAAQRKPSC